MITINGNQNKDHCWIDKKREFSRHVVTLDRKLPDSNGFTMVELIVVVAILSVLALLAIPAGFKYIENTKNTRCVGDLQTINNEIQSYYIDRSVYPASLNDIGRGAFLDPWGKPYRYTNIESEIALGNPNPALLGVIGQLNGGNDYDLWSEGQDKQTSTPAYDPTNSEDDIARASDGSFFGFRSDF